MIQMTTDGKFERVFTLGLSEFAKMYLSLPEDKLFHVLKVGRSLPAMFTNLLLEAGMEGLNFPGLTPKRGSTKA